MERNKGTQTLVIVLLSFTILFMTVGFAVFASTLNINGTVKVSPSKWSIHYVTNSYAESTGSVAATSKTIGNTDATYSVTLAKPGDFYEFTINVINDGTFDAVLKGLTMSTLTAAQQKYLTYTVTYDGTDYTASASNLSLSLPCTSGSNTKPVKVRVEYIQPEQSTDLPSEEVTVTLTASLDYEQSA